MPTTEKKENTKPIANAVFGFISPDGIGLNFVLSIFESMTLSFHIFKIADPEAPIAIITKQIALTKRLLSEGANSIAQSAVKITRDITPGLTSK